MKWNDAYFKPLGMRLSHRLPQIYCCYMRAASLLNIPNDKHRLVADTFMLSKILPLISFRDGDKSETNGEEKLAILKRWHDDSDTKEKTPMVQAALETMLSRNGVIVRYLE